MTKLLIFLLLISPNLFALCRISEVIDSIRPGATWIVTNDDLNTLVWNSTQTVPSKIEINAAISQCQQNDLNVKQQIQNDIFNIKLSTNTGAQKLPYLLDLLQQRGLIR